MAERSKALTFLYWIGVVWVRIPLDTFIFILNPPRSEQVNGAVANEIKHVHSPEVIVVLDPQIRLIIQGFVYSYLQYSFNMCKILFLTKLYIEQNSNSCNTLLKDSVSLGWNLKPFVRMLQSFQIALYNLNKYSIIPRMDCVHIS